MMLFSLPGAAVMRRDVFEGFEAVHGAGFALRWPSLHGCMGWSRFLKRLVFDVWD
jgi:hypothetical protein